MDAITILQMMFSLWQAKAKMFLRQNKVEDARAAMNVASIFFMVAWQKYGVYLEQRKDVPKFYSFCST